MFRNSFNCLSETQQKESIALVWDSWLALVQMHYDGTEKELVG